MLVLHFYVWERVQFFHIRHKIVLQLGFVDVLYVVDMRKVSILILDDDDDVSEIYKFYIHIFWGVNWWWSLIMFTRVIVPKKVCFGDLILI